MNREGRTGRHSPERPIVQHTITFQHKQCARQNKPMIRGDICRRGRTGVRPSRARPIAQRAITQKKPFGLNRRAFDCFRFKLSAYFWFFLRRAEAQRLPISRVARVPGSGWPVVLGTSALPLPWNSLGLTQ